MEEKLGNFGGEGKEREKSNEWYAILLLFTAQIFSTKIEIGVIQCAAREKITFQPKKANKNKKKKEKKKKSHSFVERQSDNIIPHTHT